MDLLPNVFVALNIGVDERPSVLPHAILNRDYP